jgi:hypothetical protein
MKTILVLTALMSVGATAPQTKLGDGVALKDATPIKALVENPREHVGKRVRIDGVATAVCSAMGCWMAVASDTEPDSPVVRLKVEDGAIVFPMTAKGRKVSAEGTFEKIGDDAHGKEAAGEHAKQDPQASASYQIKATGALID